MDCVHFQILALWKLRAGDELPPEDLQALDRHLAQCPACQTRQRDEARADEALGSAIRQVSVPPRGPANALARLQSARRPRVLPWVAAAASLLLASGLGWYLLSRPAPDVPEFIALIAEKGTFGSPTDIEAHFAAKNIPFAFPPEFNLETLSFYDEVQFMDRRVARLDFHARAQRAATAYVYVLSANHFRLTDPDFEKHVAVPNQAGKFTVQLLSHPDRTDFFYLVVFTGESLDPFRNLRGI